MSNKLEKSGAEAEWSMPEPVFRSSAGKGLRTPVPGSDISEDEVAAETEREEMMENERKDIREATTDPEGENAIEKEVKGDKLGTSMTAVGLLALLGAGVIFLLVYFLFFRDAGTVTP